jgi:hypothetical protein
LGIENKKRAGVAGKSGAVDITVEIRQKSRANRRGGFFSRT